MIEKKVVVDVGNGGKPGSISVNLQEDEIPVPPVDPPPTSEVFYRQLHDYELGVRGVNIAGTQYGEEVWYWRAQHGHPEVFHIDGGSRTPFTKPWQLLAFALSQPQLTAKKFRVVYDDRRAFNNGTGFWSKIPPAYPDPHRADFVNNIDLNGEMPSLDKIRNGGGHCMKGTVIGNWFYPEFLEYDPQAPNDGAPTVAWLKERPWLYFHAVTCHKQEDDGSPRIYPFGQGGGEPVLVPFVAKKGAMLRIPLVTLERVDKIADPYKIYIT
jgi:hypothetical protein